MLYAVHYRLRPACLAADHDRLDAVYRELALRRPSWLSCRTFRAADDETMLMSLLGLDDIGRLAEMPCLAGYLESLESRCEREPRAGPVGEPDVPEAACSIAHWDPAEDSCSLPVPGPVTGAVRAGGLSAVAGDAVLPPRHDHATAGPPGAAPAAPDRR